MCVVKCNKSSSSGILCIRRDVSLSRLCKLVCRTFRKIIILLGNFLPFHGSPKSREGVGSRTMKTISSFWHWKLHLCKDFAKSEDWKQIKVLDQPHSPFNLPLIKFGQENRDITGGTVTFSNRLTQIELWSGFIHSPPTFLV